MGVQASRAPEVERRILINLPAAANGQPVQLRWLVGTDTSVSGTGARVDGITVTNSTSVCATGAPATAKLMISEFRLRGPSGANDEFIEIYNRSETPTTVASASGTGLGVAASDGVTRCSIPNGTIIPANGHFLCTNSTAYSLSGYATGDATYTTDIPDNAGIALFNNNVGGGSYTLANRLDAVGSVAEANTLYKEGTGYATLTPFSIDYSFARTAVPLANGTTIGPNNATLPNVGYLSDTDNNATDFYFVDTNGTSAGAGQRLGAPGPENLASPVYRLTGFVRNRLDASVSLNNPPNKVRDFTSDPANNSTDRKSTRLNSSHTDISRMPSSA